MSYQIRVTQAPLCPDFAALCQCPHIETAMEVSQLENTMSLTVQDQNGAPVGLSVFGMDKGEMLTLYYAKSFIPVLGPLMMKQFFGVSEVLGVPLRVHAQSVRDIQVKARIFGASVALEGVDKEGIMQGVFSNAE
jgi:hypothetical protein